MASVVSDEITISFVDGFPTGTLSDLTLFTINENLSMYNPRFGFSIAALNAFWSLFSFGRSTSYNTNDALIP